MSRHVIVASAILFSAVAASFVSSDDRQAIRERVMGSLRPHDLRIVDQLFADWIEKSRADSQEQNDDLAKWLLGNFTIGPGETVVCANASIIICDDGDAIARGAADQLSKVTKQRVSVFRSFSRRKEPRLAIVATVLINNSAEASQSYIVLIDCTFDFYQGRWHAVSSRVRHADS